MLVFEGKFYVHPLGSDPSPFEAYARGKSTAELGVPTYARTLIGWRCADHSVGTHAELGIRDETWGTAQAAMEIRMGTPLVGKLRCGLSIFTETDVARIESELRVGAEKPVLPPPVEFVSEAEFHTLTRGRAS